MLQCMLKSFFSQIMTKREFIDKNGNTWNWDETPEVIKAVEQLHRTIKTNVVSRLHDDIREGVGK